MEQRKPIVWKYLIGVFTVFWVIFAVFLIIANIPFIIVSTALTVLLAMSAVVVGLAWAVQKGL